VFSRLFEVARVLVALPRIELARATEGPAPLVKRLRAEGARQPRRDPGARIWLRRAIVSVDARLPGGGNCYRRALLEIALDSHAAEQPFFMGLSSAGGPNSGHAWLGSDSGPARRYDAIISL
jgi:Transglutaminase-like superfamily